MLSIAKVTGATLAILALTIPAANAAVTFDPATGTGFVGKGDVQIALDMNNKQLQDSASALVFEYSSTSESATTWTCDKDSGPNTQERANTATTTTQGVVSTVARVKNQITGFNLNGFGAGSTTETETEGPAVGSCPTGWTAIDLVEGESVVTSGGLTVNGVALS